MPGNTASSPFSQLPGAVGSPPQHYGNPLGEQKLLAAGTAIVDLSDRAVVTLTGPDRLTWLDSLTSQSLAKLTPGQSAESLQLDPNGHVEFALGIFDDGESTWLLLDGDQAAPLITWLTRMKFMLRVEIADRTAEFATLGSLSDAPFEAEGVGIPIAAPAGVPIVWRDPWQDPTAGGWQYATAAQHPAAHWTYSERLVPRTALAEAAQLPAAGTLALNALRVAAWRPRVASEGDAKALPHEFDWLRSAVHLNKGCYRGQETVAKVHNLGHPPRRLVLLHLDGSDGVLPTAGDSVSNGEREVGHITSPALHFELGPIALALVKRSVDAEAILTVAAGATLGDDDQRSGGVTISAAQEIIVPVDAGATANVPRLPRLGAVIR
ncbi:MAG: YgfZ/GcvT domain-containing protein [Microbacteriaceae bacterium]